MRNPNGYGSVYKLSGNRRKPFIVRKTTGWDEGGKQLYQTIGYYEDRKSALQALADFNSNPYDVDISTITFSEVYEKWNKIKYTEIAHKSALGYIAAYNDCKSLYATKFADIKKPHMQDVINTCGKGHGSLRKMKTLFNQLFQYAMENDIVTKDYSDFVIIGKNTEKSKRVPFTQKEIDKLFEVAPMMEFVDTILIMIYTGMRVGELLLLENEKDINLEKGFIIGGIKTDAGKDRVIPINSKILDMIKKRVESGSKFLVGKDATNPMSYWNYKNEHFAQIMEQLGMTHLPHDCRHTWFTLMNNAEANNTAIKKIGGHSSFITGEKIYTHKDLEELKKAIDSI